VLSGPSLLLTALALLIEAACGYPEALLRRIGHPVIWAGAAIAWLDRRLNRGRWRRLRGAACVLALLLGAGVPAWALQWAALHALPRPAGVALLALAAASLMAQRSLASHVRAVADGLRQGLPAGRAAVAHIVGRNPETLDQAGVARAAIESLAENFSDGVVAPALWCALLGLPGIVLYKVVNTADSMIGHRTPRHERFGWAAARLDDVVNLPASRLSALLLALASGPSFGRSARAVLRDAGRHRSPNAGWPEAAMAGALGLRLAGPRVYGATRVEDGWMGDGRADADAADIERALLVYRRACLLGIAIIVGITIVAMV
jgi:adenosylcobinamide-phosphate synthase